VQSVDPGNADREDIRPDQVGDEATIARSSVVRWVSTVRTDRPRTWRYFSRQLSRPLPSY